MKTLVIILCPSGFFTAGMGTEGTGVFRMEAQTRGITGDVRVKTKCATNNTSTTYTQVPYSAKITHTLF